MRKLIKSVAATLAFLFASITAQAGEWPTTTTELLEKKITIKYGTQEDPAYWVIDIKSKEVRSYLPTFKSTLCQKSVITKISVLSEEEVKLTIVPEKEKDGWARCRIVFSTINLKEKTFTNFRFKDDDSKTLYQSGQWYNEKVLFD